MATQRQSESRWQEGLPWTTTHGIGWTQPDGCCWHRGRVLCRLATDCISQTASAFGDVAWRYWFNSLWLTKVGSVRLCSVGWAQADGDNMPQAAAWANVVWWCWAIVLHSSAWVVPCRLASHQERWPRWGGRAQREKPPVRKPTWVPSRETKQWPWLNLVKINFDLKPGPNAILTRLRSNHDQTSIFDQSYLILNFDSIWTLFLSAFT